MVIIVLRTIYTQISYNDMTLYLASLHLYFSVSEELPRPISQTLSEGQLPASSCGGGSAPLDSSEVEDLEVDYRDVKSSLNDEGINRYACIAWTGHSNTVYRCMCMLNKGMQGRLLHVPM